MEISTAGLKLIEEFEGYRSTLYYDSVGVATIGYGTTAGAGVVSPLPSSCTQAQAQQWLADYVNKAVAPAINATGCPLNQNQFDALCSLGYNLGAGCFTQPGWAVGNDLRAHNLAGVASDFSHYVYAGGTFLQGLANRRAAEQRLFNTPVVAPKPVLSYHYEWFDTTKRDSVDASEVGLVKGYDHARKHPKINARHLKTLKHKLETLAERLEAIKSAGGDMTQDHRSWRLDQLKSRAAGKVVKPS